MDTQYHYIHWKLYHNIYLGQSGEDASCMGWGVDGMAQDAQDEEEDNCSVRSVQALARVKAHHGLARDPTLP